MIEMAVIYLKNVPKVHFSAQLCHKLVLKLSSSISEFSPVGPLLSRISEFGRGVQSLLTSLLVRSATSFREASIIDAASGAVDVLNRGQAAQHIPKRQIERK